MQYFFFASATSLQRPSALKSHAIHKALSAILSGVFYKAIPVSPNMVLFKNGEHAPLFSAKMGILTHGWESFQNKTKKKSSVLDALNEIAWHDDAQITTLKVQKGYSMDGAYIALNIREDMGAI